MCVVENFHFRKKGKFSERISAFHIDQPLSTRTTVQKSIQNTDKIHRGK